MTINIAADPRVRMPISRFERLPHPASRPGEDDLGPASTWARGRASLSAGPTPSPRSPVRPLNNVISALATEPGKAKHIALHTWPTTTH